MSTCTADRHGTVSAYSNHGCRCEDAREAQRITEKRRRENRHTPPYIDSTGTSRRLRALAVLGHSGRALATELGISPQRINQLRNAELAQVRRETAEKVTALYERLSATRGSSQFTKTRAVQAGWAPPLAWDDDALDDPAAVPTGVGAPPPRRGVDLDEVRFLESFGMSRHSVAGRLGVSPESIERAEYRALEKARAAVERARAALDAADVPADVAAPVSSRELERAR
jgi:transcriptional regulator with XRE-family HTH domain